MIADNLNRNYQSLIAEFHDKGKASRGISTLEHYISKGNSKGLSKLLGHHRQRGYEGKELVQRFEVDALIECYNLLLIATLAGYVPAQWEDRMRAEIMMVMGNESVRPYYEKHYPYRMADFTLQYATMDMQMEQEADQVTMNVFNEFISLNRMLKRDEDLETFLGMLDFVSYGDEDISEVNEILSSSGLLGKAFSAKEKSEAQKGVWGFIKYTAFLSRLRLLLEQTNNYPLLQSAIWMFHGYYFDRINDKLKKTLDSAFANLAQTLANPQLFASMAEELYGANTPDEFSEDELKAFAEAMVRKAREDADFVLDSKWGDAMKSRFGTS